MAAFRDRLLTPAGARAITSPGAILLAGVGAGLGVVTGVGVAAAALLGAAGYLGGVAFAFPKVPVRPRIDAAGLRDPWRTFVLEALDSRRRFDAAVASARGGPIRDRLMAIGERLQEGVATVHAVAHHGQALEDALSHLENVDAVQHRLDEVEAELAGARAGDERLEATVEALASQLSSTARLASVARDTRERLQLLDARLDEAVARAVELSVGAADLGSVGGLGSQVDAVVEEMEALRIAVEETRRTAPL